MKSVLAFTALFYLWVLYEPATCKRFQEKQLVDDLLKNNAKIRPVAKNNDTVNAMFGLTVLDAVEEREFRHSSLMKFKMWHKLMWKDVSLQWDPAAYGGIKMVHIPVKDIWAPDIVLYNGMDAKADIDMSLLTVVTSDGSVLWVPQVVHRANCPKRGTALHCMLKFGSWTYNAKEVDVNFYDGKAETDADYWEGEEYAVVDTKAVRHEKKYDCCPDTYIDLQFNVFLREK